jgi:hypothetical protein
MIASRSIAAYEIGVFDGWGAWLPREGASSASDVAGRLGSTPSAQAQVRAAVLAFDADLPAAGDELDLGVWVPDPSTGVTWGAFVLELIRGDPAEPWTAERFLRQVRKAPKRRGERVFDYSVAAGTTPAGESVLQMMSTAPRRSGQVISSIIWTVFPSGAHDQMRCTFSTASAGAVDALALESRDIIDSLTVRLEGPE